MDASLIKSVPRFTAEWQRWAGRSGTNFVPGIYSEYGQNHFQYYNAIIEIHWKRSAASIKMPNTLIDKYREALITLCRRFHVRRLELFGSATRKDFDTQRSDLDFLVDFETGASSYF